MRWLVVGLWICAVHGASLLAEEKKEVYDDFTKAALMNDVPDHLPLNVAPIFPPVSQPPMDAAEPAAADKAKDGVDAKAAKTAPIPPLTTRTLIDASEPAAADRGLIDKSEPVAADKAKDGVDAKAAPPTPILPPLTQPPAGVSDPAVVDEEKPGVDTKDPIQILRQQLPVQPWSVGRLLVEHVLKQLKPGSKDYRDALVVAARWAAASKNRDGEPNRHGEAVLYYERALQISSVEERETRDLLIELGREYRFLNATQKALEAFYRVMTVSRDRERGPTAALKIAQWEVAETAYAGKDWEKARMFFERFTDTYPEDDELVHSAWYRIGDCSRQLAQDNRTVVDYQRALARDGEHPFAPYAHVALLEIFLERDNTEIALQSLRNLAAVVAKMPAPEAKPWQRRVGELLFRKMIELRSTDLSLKILDSLGGMDSSVEWQAQLDYWKGIARLQQEDLDVARENFAAAAGPVEATGKKKATPGEAKREGAGSVARFASDDSEIIDWILKTRQKAAELNLPAPSSDVPTRLETRR